MKIVFGTEGWRAIMAEEFTAENVRRVTQAIAEHVLESGGGAAPTMVVGHDTRFLSGYFAAAVAEVLAANGVSVTLTDRAVPTCAVSRYVVDHHLNAGVMITASHNPPLYNGVKIKESFGGSAVPETVASVEQRIDSHPVKRVTLQEALKSKSVQQANLEPDYLKGIRKSVNLAAIKKAKLKVAVDSMHGAGNGLIERLLAGGRCKVTTLHASPDPLFGGHAPEPIGKYLGELMRFVVKAKMGIGIANDGDADRIGVISSKGQFVNPGQVLCILLDHLIATRKWKGGVVKTVSNTSMIERMASGLGLKLYETPVGFKYIAKLMLTEDILIGGEESGGLGVRGYLPERDGVFIGLLLLEAMAMQGKGLLEILHRLERQYGKWIYARRDLTVPQDRINRFFDRLRANPPSTLAGVPIAEVKMVDGIKLIDRQDGWLLFRRSGTEPIVRVYAESLATSRVNRLLDHGVELIESS